MIRWLTKADKKAEQLRIDSIRAKFLEPDTEEIEIKYQTIIEYCKQFDSVFHDGEFPHTAENYGKHIAKIGKFNKMKMKNILKANKVDFLLHKLEKRNNVLWMRPIPSENGSKLKFWCPEHPFEVKQSAFPNCGLISALSAISAHQSILQRIFRDMELSEYGVYQVKLCIDGEWKTIVVDDWLPHVTGAWKGAKSDLKCYQLWPSLLEKAFAKVYGGYGQLYGFLKHTALLNITGAPIDLYSVKKYLNGSQKNVLWDVLERAGSQDFPMSCATRQENKKTKKKVSPGFYHNHVYTIVTALKLGNRRMLRIRNPWARSIWKGKTSWDESTDLLIAQFSERVISGSFWVEYEDFVKCFYSVVICRWRDSWDEIRVNMAIGGLWDDSQKVIQITVPKACEVCVSAHKPKKTKKEEVGCHRYHAHRPPKFLKTSQLSTWITIQKIDADDSEEEVVLCEAIKYSTEDVKLQPGQYIITVSNFHKSPLKEERNVCIHSSVPLCAKLCSWSPKKLIGAFQKNVLDSGRELVHTREDISIKEYHNDHSNFFIVMAQNYTFNMYLHVHTQLLDRDIFNASRGNDSNCNFGDVIPPRSSQILLLITSHSSHCQQNLRKGFPMTIEYYLSEEKTMKLRKEKRAAHIPEIGAADYIHQTVALE